MALKNAFGDLATEETINTKVTDLLYEILLELRVMNKYNELGYQTKILPEDVDDGDY